LIRALLSILHGLFSSPTEQQPEQGEKLDWLTLVFVCPIK
jgi:hypothetical protein